MPRIMTKFINAIIPPAARAVYSAFRNHGTLRFLGKTFTGVFKTFDEVARNFRGVVTYNSSESERDEVARATGSRAAADDARRGIAPGPADHYTLLSALVATLPEQAPIVLDIGGSTGDALAHLIYSCPQKEPRVIVCELPAVADAGRAAFAGEKTISFVSRLADVRPPIHVAFLGSSLQYFPDHKALLKEIAALRPRYVVIAYTPITEAPTFVTAQVNMRERIIPNQVMNRAEIVGVMKDVGFTLIHVSGSRSAAHFRNFPPPQNASSLLNMVFVSRT